MPQTIIRSQFFTDLEAAAILELPLETVRAFYRHMLTVTGTAVMMKTDPQTGNSVHALSGATIVALRELPAPETPISKAESKPRVSRRRHAVR